MAQKANQLAAEAAKPGATNAQKEAAAAAEAASQVAGNAKRAAEAAEFATRNAISQASVQAKAAAEQAAKEAAAAAALAAKDAAEQAAQEAAAVAAQAAKDAAVDAIEARIAELKSAISTVDTHDKIHSQIDYGVRSALASGNCGGPCDGQQKTYDHNYNIMQNAHDNWTKELAEEQQKLEDAKK